jgi:dihydrofolate synthase/folylpolyglutamate synthase
LLTNVDLDHVDWLGDTREKIGFEKAGIFRSGRPAIYGERSMPDSVRSYADQHAIPLLQQGQQFGWQQHGDRWDWFGEDCEGKRIELKDIPANGFPLDNAAAVLQVLQFLPVTLPRTAIDTGMARAELAGRFQQRQFQGRRVILDVAHNPHAAANLAHNIRKRLAGCDVRLVLGMLGDKDSSGVVRLLSPEVAHIYAASLGGERGAPADILYNHARQLGFSAITCHATVAEAFAAACSAAGQQPGKETVIVVTGSFFTISAVLELL